MKKKMCNFYKYNIGGFVSVEYSLLFSILLLVITFLVYIGFYQYNECILTGNTYMLGIYGTELLQTEMGKLQQNLEKKREQLYNEKYLLTETVENTFYTKGGKKILEGSLNMKNPYYTAGIGEKYWTAKAVYVMSDRKPANVLFMYKHIKKAIKEIEE